MWKRAAQYALIGLVGAAPLAIAAHTHGGQVRIPGLPAWTWINFFREEEVHADGWIDSFGAPGNHLYVNRGIGFSYVPIRINCPPEVTMFTLSRASQPVAVRQPRAVIVSTGE